jgi:hypothetical protein
MTRYLSALLLGAALLAPVAIKAQDHPQRYYDKTHKDYHEWNDSENQRYQSYQKEKNIKAHEFAKAKKSEQQDYWKWRHEHGDNH